MKRKNGEWEGGRKERGSDLGLGCRPLLDLRDVLLRVEVAGAPAAAAAVCVAHFVFLFFPFLNYLCFLILISV